VLDYIHNGNSFLYDLVAVENHTVTISPQGYDPDEEQILTYSYNGWLEQYTDYYNWDDSNCSHPSVFEYILYNCTKKNETGIPHNSWSQSLLFNTTRKNASYDASRSDIGLHTVQVAVSDREGLEDYQNVRILVFDLPVARINGSSDYEEIDDHLASYEDMYTLNGAESSVGAIAATLNIPFTTFFWNDTAEPFEKLNQIYGNIPSTKLLILPNNTMDNPDALTIMNITNFTFKNKTAAFTTHNITLTVTIQNGLSDDYTFYVNVTQCLNHSSNIPPYPYDTLPGYNIAVNNLYGHLMANHACCANTLTYKPLGAECFENSSYGMNLTFRDYTKTPESPAPYTIQYALSNSAPGNTKYDNDIFYRNFSRGCSGSRGNICTGPAAESRSNIAGQCSDTNGLPDDGTTNSAFQKERCSGPPENLFMYNSSSSVSPGCANYSTGTTFESLVYNVLHLGIASSGTGTCTTAPQCSDGTNFKAYENYDNIPGTITARYVCDGQCDGTGECNNAIHNSCKCSTSCNPQLLTADQVPDACNDVLIGDTPPKTTCGADKNYIQDRCVNCVLVDVTGAAAVCKSPGGTGNPNDGCQAPINCNNVPLNSVLSPNTPNLGCDSECKFHDCNLFRYSLTTPSGTAIGGCPAGCTSYTQCIDGNYCDTTAAAPYQCKSVNNIICNPGGADQTSICTNLAGPGYHCTTGRCRPD
jgi:hypothetical protein